MGATGSLKRAFIPLSVLIAITIMLLTIPIFVFVAVWVSHKIVGPLRRLSRDLTAVGEGRIVDGFAVRQGDELVFMSTAVSEMKKGLIERLTACRNAQARLEQAMTRFESADPVGKPSAAELKEAVAALGKELALFDLAKESSGPAQR